MKRLTFAVDDEPVFEQNLQFDFIKLKLCGEEKKNTKKFQKKNF
jgi:hypothetical protein